MRTTLVLLTLAILLGLTHGVETPTYPDLTYVSNYFFYDVVTVSAGDHIVADLRCTQPANDVRIILFSGIFDYVVIEVDSNLFPNPSV